MVEDDLRKKMTVLQYQNIKEFCEFYTIEVEEIKDHPEYAEGSKSIIQLWKN